MNKEGKNQLSQSLASEETTPLLSKKEAIDLYSSAIIPGKHTSEPAAGTSRISEKDEAETVLEAETSKKCLDKDEEKMAEHISSIEGMVDIVTPPFGCGLFYGIWLCVCHILSSFMIQFPLHILLLPLPISIGFMGARYMTQCPMNRKLPYLMMVVGGFGVLVLLVRIALLLHAKFSTNEILKKWLKKATKFLECVFLLSVILEFCFSYKYSPSDDPLSPNYCETSFFSFVSSINDVLIVLVVVWIVLYFITGQSCMRRAVPP